MSIAAVAAYDRDTLAKWYAARHFKTDSGVEKVFYLPVGAPEREIRLLEVNDLISETTPLEPIDFGVDIGGAGAHTLNVLDVTPGQWEGIASARIPLPAGWTLEGIQELGKR